MITVETIGTVRNRVRDPRPTGWEDVESTIELRPELAEAVDGLDLYSHVTVVFVMHRVPAEARAMRVRIADGVPEQGVLATRSQRRPNPVGVTVVPLLELRGARLRVRGLDAIDGSPVLDVRPYIPHYDSVPGARVPPWARPPQG